ncbi:histone H2A-like [Scyliorhinus torazame]|uniref:Histone H2A n=1 Tax=Scyliorhinus torazame TaxID=75743 RepID=A0A401PNL5_SCYTO|nr:hypothetical protein [Scyliorhinus torazame]
MSSRGKIRGKGHAKAKTCSSRAGLQFPIGRIHQLLCKGHYAKWVGAGAPVYLVVLECLTITILELPAKQPRTTNNLTSSRHLKLTICNDKELKKLLGGVTINQDGILPNIQIELLPKETGHPSKVYA